MCQLRRAKTLVGFTAETKVSAVSRRVLRTTFSKRSFHQRCRRCAAGGVPVDAAIHRVSVILIPVPRHCERGNRSLAGDASAGTASRRIAGADGAVASTADKSTRSQLLAGATVYAVDVETRGGVESIFGSVVAVLRDLAGIIQL